MDVVPEVTIPTTQEVQLITTTVSKLHTHGRPFETLGTLLFYIILPFVLLMSLLLSVPKNLRDLVSKGPRL